MIYLDQNGNEQWRKHVKGKSRKKEERLSDIKLNRDGSIILAGTSAEELGKENWKIVKLGDKQLDQLIEKLDIKFILTLFLITVMLKSDLILKKQISRFTIWVEDSSKH